MKSSATIKHALICAAILACFVAVNIIENTDGAFAPSHQEG